MAKQEKNTSLVGKNVTLSGNRNFVQGDYLVIAAGAKSDFPRKAGKQMIKAIASGQFEPKTAVPEGSTLFVTSLEGQHLVIAVPESGLNTGANVNFEDFA